MSDLRSHVLLYSKIYKMSISTYLFLAHLENIKTILPSTSFVTFYDFPGSLMLE